MHLFKHTKTSQIIDYFILGVGTFFKKKVFSETSVQAIRCRKFYE